MYEQHFGLSKRPFSAKATGAEVFVGPQTAKTMAGFRKALAAQDAVVTVSGAVGTGKTTLVERALDAMGSRYKTIRVGRMRMNASDVLESLLIVLGVKDRPSGTIQRFTALRKKLRELQDAGTRVFIVVEDALRTGPETLAELEALTVADAGESDGASIVLMGDERLFDLMKDPQLAQLQQRVRQRHRIQPLCVAELRGYLKHSFRLAGGDFEQIFDARSAELLQGLSEGIPRIANTIVDAVLVAAASQGVDTISATMIATVAADEFGHSVENFDFSEPPPDDPPVADQSRRDTVAAEPAPAVEPKHEPAVEQQPAPAPVSEAEPLPVEELAAQLEALSEPASEPGSEPAIVFADEEQQSPEESLGIPHLIQDTLPDLAILSERYATLDPVDSTEAQDAAAHRETDADLIPELNPEAAAPAEPAAEGASEQATIAMLEDPAEDIPELVAEPSTAAPPKWELSSEPEFQLATGVVPVLESEETSEAVAAAQPLAEEIPGPQADAAAEPIAEELPELVAEAEPLAEEIPGPQADAAAEPIAEELPELVAEAEPEASGREIPEWDRDPTLAQLKPDLDALEQAMAFTHGEPLLKSGEAASQPEDLADRAADIEELPEIILDKAIATGIDNLSIEEPSDIRPPTPVTKPDAQLDRIAADIANAKSLEDIDDIMAETLFGTGISMIAAQVTANPPPDDSANDALDLVEEAPMASAPAIQEKVAPVLEQKSAPGRSDISEEVSIETRPPVANTGLDLSASQRLKTVRALNADLHPLLREPQNEPGGKAMGSIDAPQPIEDQINTSITQTLKALKVPPPVAEDDPEEARKKGFLSRFRRS